MENRDEHTYQPFFVVGPLRSGTTLLRLLLDHHPDINCFGELECAVSQAVGNQWPSLNNFHKFLELDRQTKNYAFSVDRSLEYTELVKSFLDQLHTRNPLQFVGASVHSRMDLLPEIWPNAKYIKLFRDPRDVARSCIGMGWVGNVYYGADYWVETERHWEILDKNTSGQSISVWYEDLVAEPEKELMRISEFLGCSYSPAMLDLERDTTYSRPDPRLANQWKKKLTEKQIQLVESKCASLMESRKYSLSKEEVRTPGVLEKAALWMQNRAYRISFNIKQFGFLNWLTFSLSKRLKIGFIYERQQLRLNEIQQKSLK